jgi:hypothetical protein
MINLKSKLHGAKNFILGMVTMALIFSLIMTVSAIIETKTATVTYNDIKVNIDGEETILTDLQGNAIEPVMMFDTLYVPMSPMARAFGYTSTYEGGSKTVFIKGNKATETAPASTPTIGISETTIKIDGFIEKARAVENSGAWYIHLTDVLQHWMGDKTAPDYKFSFNESTKILSISLPSPIAGGVPIRELLDKHNIKYDVSVDDVITVDMTLGSNNAKMTIDTTKDKGKVTFNGKTAEFEFKFSGGTTFVMEDSFVKALKDVGFMK